MFGSRKVSLDESHVPSPTCIVCEEYVAPPGADSASVDMFDIEVFFMYYVYLQGGRDVVSRQFVNGIQSFLSLAILLRI